MKFGGIRIPFLEIGIAFQNPFEIVFPPDQYSRLSSSMVIFFCPPTLMPRSMEMKVFILMSKIRSIPRPLKS
jgi:hypothetical protein